MYAITSEPLPKALLAAALACGAVKLLDDLLDEISAPLSLRSGRAVYCSLLVCLACVTSVRVAVPIFLAAYVSGMLLKPVTDGRSRWVIGLETAIVGMIGAHAGGVPTMVSALLLAFSIQVVDDFMDNQKDERDGITNLVSRFGATESALAALGFAALSLALDVRLFLAGTFGVTLVWCAEWLWSK